MNRALLLVLGSVACGCSQPAQPTPVIAERADGPAAPALAPQAAPDLNTYEGVVTDLVAKLTDDDRALLRKTAKDDLIQFHHGVSTSIRNTYGLWTNSALRKSCAKQRGEDDMHPDSASMVIIEGVWAAVNAGK